MLTVTIPHQELYDEVHDEFIEIRQQTLTLEHSLVSISKWESKWKKPFLVNNKKTVEETIDYIKCMTLTQNVDPKVYHFIPPPVMKQIGAYIKDPMTATKFSEKEKRGSNRVLTSELIYCWMASLGIPMECQKWHINRLLTLIRVCSLENQPPKKMSKADTMRQNSALNSARRKARRSKG